MRCPSCNEGELKIKKYKGWEKRKAVMACDVCGNKEIFK
jgi:uncharacterized protein (DUF983 family)